MRGFLLMLLAGLAAAGAGLALHEAAARGLVEGIALDVGMLVAIVLAGWFAIRAVVNLVRALSRRSESIAIFNKGFLWQIGKTQHRYKWGQLVTFREGARGIYLFGRPLLRWGAHRLRMADDRIFKFGARHGDPREFAYIVRPYAAHVTSISMGRRLRADRPIRLHPALTVYPRGIEAGATEIHWADLNVKVKRGRLMIQKRAGGEFRTVRSYPIAQVDNVGGLLELLKSLLPQHQPERLRTGKHAAALRKYRQYRQKEVHERAE